MISDIIIDYYKGNDEERNNILNEYSQNFELPFIIILFLNKYSIFNPWEKIYKVSGWIKDLVKLLLLMI